MGESPFFSNSTFQFQVFPIFCDVIEKLSEEFDSIGFMLAMTVKLPIFSRDLNEEMKISVNVLSTVDIKAHLAFVNPVVLG